MSLIINDQVVVGPGNSPYIGANGNWFVGKNDTGYSAGMDIFYKTTNEFKTCYEEGVYYVHDDETRTLEIWHIDGIGYKTQVVSGNLVIPVVGDNGHWFIGETDLGIPAISDGVTYSGATIDDDVINATTAWSSYKINREMEQLKYDGIPGKNLEFKWDDTKLGVRQEGSEEYGYRDLIGPPGLAGLDGSSIFDAFIDEHGHLILTVQDEEDARATHQILSTELGVFTKEDLVTILNNINRLNREIYNIKSSQFRQIIPYRTHTDGEFDQVYKFTGSGNCQILVGKFTGTIRVTVDGSVYTFTAQTMDDMSESSLVSINSSNQLVLCGLFDADGGARSLDIGFRTSLLIEVLVDDNEEKVYPKFLLQGNYYYSASSNPDPDDGGGDHVPADAMTDEDVDAMMGLL